MKLNEINKKGNQSSFVEFVGLILGIVFFIATLCFALMSLVSFSDGGWIVLVLGVAMSIGLLFVTSKSREDSKIYYFSSLLATSMIGGLVIIGAIAAIFGAVKVGLDVYNNHEAKVNAQKEMTYKLLPEKLVESIIGNSDIHAKFQDDENQITITYDLDPWALTGSTAISSFNGQIAKLMPVFFSRYPNIQMIEVIGQGEFADQRGNSSRGDMVRITFSRQNSSNINWGNINYGDIPKIADFYWVDPSVINPALE